MKMNMQMKENLALHEKFEKTIAWPSLVFSEPNLEKQYHEKRLDSFKLSFAFKFGLVAIMTILAFRRIELLIFTASDVEAMSTTPTAEYIQTAAMLAVTILEVTFYFVSLLNKFKGFFVMVYIFFIICYSSRVYISEKPSTVPVYAAPVLFVEEFQCTSEQ